MRVQPGPATRRRHKRMLKDAKGNVAARGTLFRPAKQTVIKAGQYAFRDRRAKKRNFRALWVTRVTAACEMRGISYSRFMGTLRSLNIGLNRKMLSEIAIADPAGFDQITSLALSAAGAPVAPKATA